MISLSLRNALACHVVITKQLGKRFFEENSATNLLYRSNESKNTGQRHVSRHVKDARWHIKHWWKPLSNYFSRSKWEVIIERRRKWSCAFPLKTKKSLAPNGQSRDSSRELSGFSTSLCHLLSTICMESVVQSDLRNNNHFHVKKPQYKRSYVLHTISGIWWSWRYRKCMYNIQPLSIYKGQARRTPTWSRALTIKDVTFGP